MKDFLTEFKKLHVGSDFTPLKKKWQRLLYSWNGHMERLSDLRRTLDDHDHDVRKSKSRKNRKTRASIDKIRSQYHNGNSPRAVAAEVVALTEDEATP